MNWANDKVEELTEDCIQTILQSNVMGSDNVTIEEITESIIEVVENVTSDICPSQCSNQGECANSECNCYTGKLLRKSGFDLRIMCFN